LNEKIQDCKEEELLLHVRWLASQWRDEDHQSDNQRPKVIGLRIIIINVTIVINMARMNHDGDDLMK